MATIHKCDKCGKTIRENEINITFTDFDRRLFERQTCSSFDFCVDCAKPLAVYLKGFLKFNNTANKK